jgi:hypothetical protein
MEMTKDTVVYEFKLTLESLFEMVNYMENESDQINELTKDQLDELDAYLGDAVTEAISDFIQTLRN